MGSYPQDLLRSVTIFYVSTKLFRASRGATVFAVNRPLDRPKVPQYRVKGGHKDGAPVGIFEIQIEYPEREGTVYNACCAAIQPKTLYMTGVASPNG